MSNPNTFLWIPFWILWKLRALSRLWSLNIPLTLGIYLYKSMYQAKKLVYWIRIERVSFQSNFIISSIGWLIGWFHRLVKTYAYFRKNHETKYILCDHSNKFERLMRHLIHCSHIRWYQSLVFVHVSWMAYHDII